MALLKQLLKEMRELREKVDKLQGQGVVGSMPDSKPEGLGSTPSVPASFSDAG